MPLYTPAHPSSSSFYGGIHRSFQERLAPSPRHHPIPATAPSQRDAAETQPAPTSCTLPSLIPETLRALDAEMQLEGRMQGTEGRWADNQAEAQAQRRQALRAIGVPSFEATCKVKLMCNMRARVRVCCIAYVMFLLQNYAVENIKSICVVTLRQKPSNPHPLIHTHVLPAGCRSDPPPPWSDHHLPAQHRPLL